MELKSLTEQKSLLATLAPGKRARLRRLLFEFGLGQDGPLEDILRGVEQDGGAYVVVLELPEDVAGAYVKRPQMPLLVVNGREWVTRQRFTLAHEFGHFRMGHDGVVDRQVSMSGYDHDPCEVEANAFGRSPVQKSRLALRETRRFDGIVESLAELQDSRIGRVGLRSRHKVAIRGEWMLRNSKHRVGTTVSGRVGTG